MIRAILAVASLAMLAACAGPQPVGPPVDSAVSIADTAAAIDRRRLLGRWRCAQANAPSGAEMPVQVLEYTIDGVGRSTSETAGGPPGTMLAEARLVVETRWRWGILDERLEQSGMVSMVRPGDGEPISAVAARAAQVSLDALAEAAPKVTRLEVLQLDETTLMLRPEGRPQIVSCSRLQ